MAPVASTVLAMDPEVVADQTLTLMTAFDQLNRQIPTTRLSAAPATLSATLDLVDLGAEDHHALALPYLPDYTVVWVSSTQLLESVALVTNRATAGRGIQIFSVEQGLPDAVRALAQTFPSASTIRIHSTRPDAVRTAVNQVTATGVMDVRFDVVETAGLQELLLNIGVIDQGALDVLLDLVERAKHLIRYL